jgi:hypothetical protein
LMKHSEVVAEAVRKGVRKFTPHLSDAPRASKAKALKLKGPATMGPLFISFERYSVSQARRAQ